MMVTVSKSSNLGFFILVCDDLEDPLGGDFFSLFCCVFVVVVVCVCV